MPLAHHARPGADDHLTGWLVSASGPQPRPAHAARPPGRPYYRTPGDPCSTPGRPLPHTRPPPTARPVGPGGPQATAARTRRRADGWACRRVDARTGGRVDARTGGRVDARILAIGHFVHHIRTPGPSPCGSGAQSPGDRLGRSVAPRVMSVGWDRNSWNGRRARDVAEQAGPCVGRTWTRCQRPAELWHSPCRPDLGRSPSDPGRW